MDIIKLVQRLGNATHQNFLVGKDGEKYIVFSTCDEDTAEFIMEKNKKQIIHYIQDDLSKYVIKGNEQAVLQWIQEEIKRSNEIF